MIFVHGLGGHVYATWRRKADDDSFWPLWLARNVEGLTVYTLSYEAPPSNWLGTAMPLQDRAVNILECLLSEAGLRDGPITFICHSLGGLLVKQIMQDLQRQKGRRPEAATLLDRITQVVFLAIPHTGSKQGSWLERLRFLAWPSSITRTLVANDPTFRKTGDRANALKALGEGQTIMAHLTQVSPDNAQWQQDLIWFNKEIAELNRSSARSDHRASSRR